MNNPEMNNGLITKLVSDQLIKDGRRPYCLLSIGFISDEDWLNLYDGGFMSGGYVLESDCLTVE